MEKYSRKVRYYECDAMGVMHHSNYIRVMEEARIDYLDRIGYNFAKLGAEGIVSPVVSLNCRYLKPARFDDVVETEVRIVLMTSLKLTLSYEMTVAGTVVFTAESVHCFVENGRPIIIPERFPLLSGSLA